MIDKTFLLAGQATFTIEHPATKEREAGHHTYRVERVEASDRWPEAFFVKVLTGPNNEADYVYLGKLDTFTGQVKLTAKSAFPADSWRVRLLNRVLCRLWGGEAAVIEQAGYKVHHEGHCGRCGRLLTVPSSVESGIGPECARIMGIAPAAKPRKAKQEEPETYEASDRNPELADVTDLQPAYDKEGELLWWNGKRKGKPVRIFND